MFGIFWNLAWLQTSSVVYGCEAGGQFSAENHSENAWNPWLESVPKQSGTAQAFPRALTLIELWCEIKLGRY